MVGLAGAVSVIGPGSSNFVFADPTVTVTTSGMQRITGTVTAILGLNSSGSQPTDFGLCYRNTATPMATPTNFFGTNYLTVPVVLERRPYAVSATTVPGTGTFTVGMCIRNSGALAISSNDFANGWFMVTN